MKAITLEETYTTILKRKQVQQDRFSRSGDMAEILGEIREI